MATVGLHLICRKLLALAESAPTGLSELGAEVAAWSLFWVVSFYILAFSYPWWSARFLTSSQKKHENERYWCTRNVIGIFHAVLVAALSLPAAFALIGAPDHQRFPASLDLAWCPPSKDHDLSQLKSAYEWVALGGLAFTTFTLTDLVLSSIHGLADTAYVVHHIAFATAGLIIRSHCMLPFNAALLLGMEASTPFLNYVILVRNRGDAYKNSVVCCGILFLLTYLVFRIFLNGYGTFVLWIALIDGVATPAWVPAWQGWMMGVAITVGAVLQLFWLPMVWDAFGRRILALFKNGCVSTSDECPEATSHQEEALLSNGRGPV